MFWVYALTFALACLQTILAKRGIVNGDTAFAKANDLFIVGRHKEAAELFWISVIKRDSASSYPVDQAFTNFLSCYERMGKLDEGYLYVSGQYFGYKQSTEALLFLERALEINSKNRAALELYRTHTGSDYKPVKKQKVNPAEDMKNRRKSDGELKSTYNSTWLTILKDDPNNIQAHLELGNAYFSDREWLNSLRHYQAAYRLSAQVDDTRNMDLCYSVSAYLRSYMGIWGPKSIPAGIATEDIISGIPSLGCDASGSCNAYGNDEVDEFNQFYKADMRELQHIIQREKNSTMLLNSVRASSVVHPHMSLGFQMPLDLKLAVAKSHAKAEDALVREAGLLPVNHTTVSMLRKYKHEAFGGKTWENPRNLAFQKGFRIKIGYVSANIKAKTTTFMAQDLMRFHNKKKFEVHVYATSPQDTDMFLQVAMRGVDWRTKVKNSVEFFHEVDKLDVRALSTLIQKHGIHILLNWDGYSNNGVRAAGLFPLMSSPVQIAHQEYMGTIGASYIQYLITDAVACPPHLSHHYAEKFLYMPHSFLANSFSYQRDHMPPPPKIHDPENSPQKNACGADRSASFVYCNFNKHLKFNPDLFRLWLRVLESVDGSMLCLLENPVESIPFINKFVESYNASLSGRVRFQPFLNNPYDNQRRTLLMCNAVLDSQIYNGHTTAGDALWGGVPIITYGGDEEMAGRVGSSVLTAVGMQDLIADSMKQYEALAVRFGTDSKFFNKYRKYLVESTTATNPMNPLWDLKRYVGALEDGFEQIWRAFLDQESFNREYVGIRNGTFPRGVSQYHIYARDPENAPTNSISEEVLPGKEKALGKSKKKKGGKEGKEPASKKDKKNKSSNKKNEKDTKKKSETAKQKKGKSGRKSKKSRK